ncbi:MAG: hypothetical protein ACRCZB_07495, partial [Bacteroidales bacterium]
NGILLDENFEIMVAQNSLQLGDPTSQNAEMLLRANRGEIKEVPLIGGETMKLQNGILSSLWAVQVKKQMEAVDIPVQGVSVKDNVISVTQ